MAPPVGTIRVDPDALLDAVSEIGAAVAGLDTARSVLESVNDRLQDGAVLDQGGDADHKIHTFRRQWNEEFEMIGSMLGNVDAALVAAAEVYATTDLEFANALADCTG